MSHSVIINCYVWWYVLNKKIWTTYVVGKIYDDGTKLIACARMRVKVRKLCISGNSRRRWRGKGRKEKEETGGIERTVNIVTVLFSFVLCPDIIIQHIGSRHVRYIHIARCPIRLFRWCYCHCWCARLSNDASLNAIIN